MTDVSGDAFCGVAETREFNSLRQLREHNPIFIGWRRTHGEAFWLRLPYFTILKDAKQATNVASVGIGMLRAPAHFTRKGRRLLAVLVLRQRLNAYKHR